MKYEVSFNKLTLRVMYEPSHSRSFQSMIMLISQNIMFDHIGAMLIVKQELWKNPKKIRA